MIKEGDKVICIAWHMHSSNDEFYKVLTHKEGNWYEIARVDSSDDTVYVTAEENYSDDVYGLWFNLKSDATGNYENSISRDYFADYFITLAEWRQQQIDKILEDD